MNIIELLETRARTLSEMSYAHPKDDREQLRIRAGVLLDIAYVLKVLGGRGDVEVGLVDTEVPEEPGK